MAHLDESSTNQAKFSLTIAKHLFSKESDKNVVFSPLSLQVVLSIIAVGSDGPTQQQLLDFLRFKSIDHLNFFVSHLLYVLLKDATSSGGPHLSFANGVWVEKTLSLQPSFKETMSTDYKAALSSVDFRNKAIEVTKQVNLWAEKETYGLIKEILPQASVDSLTRLIFANALYFKGAWSNPFPAWRTSEYDFHLPNGSSVKVPFMSSNLDQFIRAFDGFKVLRLPYN
ncbi:putative Serpin family protein [Medicago truncatula]|uniref:Putative Serpin family protein n=1 Tax=Medicago truncatula TaxID=3880 RepID=A0A396GE96_MEDTR|nr:putative Serpin family protein [Medicago truncatula]